MKGCIKQFFVFACLNNIKVFPNRVFDICWIYERFVCLNVNDYIVLFWYWGPFGFSAGNWKREEGWGYIYKGKGKGNTSHIPQRSK